MGKNKGKKIRNQPPRPPRYPVIVWLRVPTYKGIKQLASMEGITVSRLISELIESGIPGGDL